METLTFDQVRVIKNESVGLKDSIERVMTSDHYVYVVHASPNAVQPFHNHATDWSLIIVSGSMVLTCDDTPYELNPGDTLLLPRRTKHSSKAGPEGCTFLEVEAENAVGLVKEWNDDWRPYFENDKEVFFSLESTFNDQVNADHWTRDKVVFDEVKLMEGEPIGLEKAILKVMPHDHFVAVMNESSNAVTEYHKHSLDETLFVVHGKLTVTANGASYDMTSGDRLLLPANVVHGSVAGEEGCIYLIMKLMEDAHYTARIK